LAYDQPPRSKNSAHPPSTRQAGWSGNMPSTLLAGLSASLGESGDVQPGRRCQAPHVTATPLQLHGAVTATQMMTWMKRRHDPGLFFEKMELKTCSQMRMIRGGAGRPRRCQATDRLQANADLRAHHHAPRVVTPHARRCCATTPAISETELHIRMPDRPASRRGVRAI
jgi:hypothetical protein